MITETGWPSRPVAGQPELKVSEQGQAGGHFDRISLRANGGAPKADYEDWWKLGGLPVE